MNRNERADLAKQRCYALAAMVRDEEPDSVIAWWRSLSQADQEALVMVAGAALPETTKGFQAAWAWCDGYAPSPVSAREVVRARQRGFRDEDIARALRCPVEDLPPRMKAVS